MSNWQLAEAHRVQYFYPRKSLAKLLKEMSDWTDTSGVEVHSASIDAGYDQERQAATFAATIVYFGGSNA